MRDRRPWFGVIALAALASACGGSPALRAPASAAVTPKSLAGAGSACKRSAAGPAFEVIGASRQSSTVALARFGSRSVAFVADADAKAIFTVDVDTKKQLAVTRLDAVPSQLLATNDGRVIVALKDTNRVEVLEPVAAETALTARCAVEVAVEPVALASTPDDATVVVTSAWGATLTALDAATLTTRFTVPVEREPRAVVITSDGKEAVVSHAVGSKLSRVELTTHQVKTVALVTKNLDMEAMRRMDNDRGRGCQGYALAKSTEPAGRILAPQVMVDPGDIDQRQEGYGDSNTPTEHPDVAILDEGTMDIVPASLMSGPRLEEMVRSRDNVPVPTCLLPRAAAVDDASQTLFVTCFGSDQIIAYDALAARPTDAERMSWKVAAGPSGIAIDSSKHRAVVWSQFDRKLSVLDIDGVTKAHESTTAPETLALTMPSDIAIPRELLIGRQLFHSIADSRISHDGRACASCHPDGRDDALTWATPDGPRRSITLASRLTNTAPFGWNGAGTDLHDHLARTFDRLTGSGLSSAELDALLAYVDSLKLPTPRVDAASEVVARGKDVFHNPATGCATCHAGAQLTDGKSHDVESKAHSDKSGSFDTPSLSFLAGRAPYFHDGRYATLKDLLQDSDGRMGHTGHLSEADRTALEAYLRSL